LVYVLASGRAEVARSAAARLHLTQPPLSAQLTAWTLKAARTPLVPDRSESMGTVAPLATRNDPQLSTHSRGHHQRPSQPRGVAAVSLLNRVAVEAPTRDDEQVLTI
jgi:hypothetical protein